jgi:hypothetical protein
MRVNGRAALAIGSPGRGGRVCLPLSREPGYLSAVTAPPSPRPRPRTALALLLALAGAACAAPPPGGPAGAREAGGSVATSAAAPAAGREATGQPRPLAALAGQRALLLPVQQVVPGADLGVTAPALDAELAFALEERGLAGTWTTAAAARRLAARNPSYAADPARLALPASGRLRAGDPVPEPLASQLRTLGALADARWAVLPEELRADPAAGGDASAVLRLLLVDVRLAQVLWAGGTAGVALATTSPAARAPRVAAQFVDLIVAPPEP